MVIGLIGGKLIQSAGEDVTGSFYNFMADAEFSHCVGVCKHTSSSVLLAARDCH